MGLIAKHLSKFKSDEKTGFTAVNLAEIKKAETPEGGKEPFKLDDFNELVKLGYCSTAQLKSADEILTNIKLDVFNKAFRLQKMVMTINAVNDQKRKNGTR